MANIRKRSIRAYLLMESLISISLLTILVTVVLSAVTKSHQENRELVQQIETYNVAQMAIQTGQQKLSINGVCIDTYYENNNILIKSAGKELMRFEEKD